MSGVASHPHHLHHYQKHHCQSHVPNHLFPITCSQSLVPNHLLPITQPSSCPHTRGDWALVVSLADYDLLIAPHQHTPTLQLVVQVHDNTETGLPLDGRLATIEGLVAYMLDLGMGPMEDGLLVDSNDMWLGVGAWDDGAWDGRRDKAPWLGEEEEEEMGTVIY